MTEEKLTPTPHFLPAVSGLRCHAVTVRPGDVRGRCPHAQVDHSDLCRKHSLDERAGIPVLRVREPREASR